MAHKSSSVWPSVDTPDHLKNREYRLKLAKAMYSSFKNNGSNIFRNAETEYLKKREYARGMQPIDHYKKGLGFSEKDEYNKISWKIFNVATKTVNAVVNKICETKYDPVAQALDLNNIQEIVEKRAKKKAAIDVKKFVQETFGKEPSTVGDMSTDMLPQSIDEVDEEKEEILSEIEMLVNNFLHQNSFDSSIRRMIVEDIVVLGVGCAHVGNDGRGHVPVKRWRPEDVLCSPFEGPFCDDLDWVGHIENMSITQFKQYANDLTEKQKKEVFEKHLQRQNKHNRNGSVLSYYSTLFEGQNGINEVDDYIQVMKFYYKDVSRTHYEIKPNQYGNKKVYKNKKAASDYKKKRYEGEREYYDQQQEVIQTGYWILGSDIVFGDGVMTNMEGKDGMCYKKRIPVCLYATQTLKGEPYSLIDNLVPLFDEIQMLWLQYQKSIASYIPAGVNIDPEAFTDVIAIGKKSMGTKEMMELMYQTGISFTRRDNPNTQYRSPIEPIVYRDMNEPMNFMSMIAQAIQMINLVVGQIDHTNMDEDIGVGNAKIKIQQTNILLNHLDEADANIYVCICEAIVKQVQNIIRAGLEPVGIEKALGSRTLSFWKRHDDLRLRQYGIKLEARPNNNEWNQFNQELMRATEKGVIDPEDKFRIMRMDNLKDAQNYFSKVTKKKKEEAMKRAQQEAQMQAQANAQAAQASEQAKQQTLQLKHQMDMEKLQAEYQLKMKLAQIEGQFKLQQASGNDQAKIGVAAIQAGAHTEGKETDMKARLMDDKTTSPGDNSKN